MLKNKKVSFLTRITLGLALLFYVLRSHFVDFTFLRSFIMNPKLLLIASFFIVGSVIVCGYRWFVITHMVGLELRFSEIVNLTMAGFFFNTFLPGSVGGDIIKAWYIAKHRPLKKAQAALTVLWDRILGLAILLMYAGLASFFISNDTKIQKDFYFLLIGLKIFSIFFLGLCCFLLFFLPQSYLVSVTHAINRRQDFRGKRMLEGGLRLVSLFITQPKNVGIIFITSTVSLFFTIALYSIMGVVIFNKSILWTTYCIILPLGLTLSSVPLLPGGLGVGQLAFFNLFKMFHIEPFSMGSTLNILVQIYTILLSSIGFFFYLHIKTQEKMRLKI